MFKNSKISLPFTILLIGFILLAFFSYNTINRKNKKISSLTSRLESFSFINNYKITNEEKQELLSSTKSQLKQDIFVYLESNKKNNGFFVEFGATDGVALSNSYMLETKFGWKGILAEPAKLWHERLKRNRPNSIIETLLVWKDTDSKLSFNETSIPELSTINQFSSSDGHTNSRKKGNIYEVSTISLLDLLNKHKAPKRIDYLSIDTEGSELEILEAFFKNNNYYQINIITCEHNFTSNREKIYNLLTQQGYKRTLEQFSEFDDFYVLEKIT